MSSGAGCGWRGSAVLDATLQVWRPCRVCACDARAWDLGWSRPPRRVRPHGVAVTCARGFSRVVGPSLTSAGFSDTLGLTDVAAPGDGVIRGVPASLSVCRRHTRTLHSCEVMPDGSRRAIGRRGAMAPEPEGSQGAGRLARSWIMRTQAPGRLHSSGPDAMSSAGSTAPRPQA